VAGAGAARASGSLVAPASAAAAARPALHRMPLEQDMGPMLDRGELDAIISPNAPVLSTMTRRP
jgi:hypothetical protein